MAKLQFRNCIDILPLCSGIISGKRQSFYIQYTYMKCVVHVKIRQMQNDYEADSFFSELFSNMTRKIPPNVDHYQRIKCISALLFYSRIP